jgi:carboxypeptidase PM20D1
MMLRLMISILFLSGTYASSAAVSSPAENLAQAVRYRTVSEQDKGKIDYAQFDQFHVFLRATYPRVFAQLEVEVINKHSLLLRWQGTESSELPILFTGHMDVVPIEPGTEGDWDHPPFAGVVADGKIYGRGTLDDKEGVIGLLEATEQLLAEGYQPRRSIVLAFGHDEEISGGEGASVIAQRMKELGLHFEWMVDEGGMIISDYPLTRNKSVALINVAEKTYLTLTLVATGEGGHSSTPPAVSTIGRLSAALSRIEQNPFPSRLVGPVKAMLEGIGPHSGQPSQFVFSNLWLTGGIVRYQMSQDRLTNAYVRTTTALTLFNAGVKENVVPQRAEAKVNFRLLPGDSPDYVLKTIREIVADQSIDISYQDWKAAAPVADYAGSGYAVIKGAINHVFPDTVVVPSLLSGATDTRHYIELVDNVYRFRGIVLLSAQAKGVHGTNEYIGVESFEKSIAVAKHMMKLGAGTQ